MHELPTCKEPTDSFKIRPSKLKPGRSTMEFDPPLPGENSTSDEHILHSTSVKFLGLHFDSKLSWVAHIKLLKAKSLRSTKILKNLSHPWTGCNQSELLHIYQALIRSKLITALRSMVSSDPHTSSCLTHSNQLGYVLSRIPSALALLSVYALKRPLSRIFLQLNTPVTLQITHQFQFTIGYSIIVSDHPQQNHSSPCAPISNSPDHTSIRFPYYPPFSASPPPT